MIRHPIWYQPPTVKEGHALATVHVELETKTKLIGLAAWIPDPLEYKMYFNSHNFFGVDGQAYESWKERPFLFVDLTAEKMREALLKIMENGN